MATVNAPASVRKVRSLAATAIAEGEGFSRETWLLIGGSAAAVVLWIIGALNYLGTLNILFAPSDSPGANPAVDFFVLGMLCLMAPYGFAMTAKLRKISKI